MNRSRGYGLDLILENPNVEILHLMVRVIQIVRRPRNFSVTRFFAHFAGLCASVPRHLACIRSIRMRRKARSAMRHPPSIWLPLVFLEGMVKNVSCKLLCYATELTHAIFPRLI